MQKTDLYKIIGIIVGGILILILWPFVSREENPVSSEVNSFEECVALGNPVMESYPEQCRTKDGKHFVRNIGNELEKIDLIRLENPRPGQKITSPLKIKGQAKGYWFFEASFPVILTDWDGKIIAEGFIMTSNDWMTEDFVEFDGELVFKKPEYNERGTLILQKDNPSGLPEHDDALEIPVIFE